MADRVGPAAAPGAAGSPTDPAEAGPAARPMEQAGMAAGPVAELPPETPAAVGKAAPAASSSVAPGTEAQGEAEAVSRPWGPWAGRRPGTALSGCAPEASSRRLTAGRGSSAVEAAPAEDRAAGIAGTPEVRADKAADRAAGTAAVRTRGAPAVAGPSPSARPEGSEPPAAGHIAAAAPSVGLEPEERPAALRRPHTAEPKREAPAGTGR